MLFLSGNKFIDKWVNNYDPMIDYFDLFQSKIEKKYGEEVKDKIITLILQLAIELKALNDEDFKQKLQNKVSQYKEELMSLENKGKFIENQANQKKKTEKQIKKIDEIVNDKNLLLEEYRRRNENLPLEKKIFSVRILKNILREERKGLLEKIKEYNQNMNPNVFLEKRKTLEQKLVYMDIVGDISYKEILKKEAELQIEIIKCIDIKLKKIEEKNDITNLIYEYRYYNLLPVTQTKNISELKILEKSLNKLTKDLIDKAIEMKVINRISNDDEVNYNIIKKIFLSKIISLEDIDLTPYTKEDGIYLIIFDEEIEDTRIKIDNITKEDLNIRFNKKTKFFI